MIADPKSQEAISQDFAAQLPVGVPAISVFETKLFIHLHSIYVCIPLI